MSASKVYFTDMRCPVGTGLLDKLKKLIEKAGIDSIDMDNKFVAIKIHFGEPGNLSFLRPNFAKVVADKVTSLGGRPFLTDCNTLYVGRRKHALEHLAAAQENGFSPLSTGCQMIIADGLKGTDEMEVPLEGCDHFQSAFIGRAIMDADIFISLPLQGARADRLRRCHQEHRHGLRQPCGQDGHAQHRQAQHRPRKMPWLQDLYALLRPVGHQHRRRPQGPHRP